MSNGHDSHTVTTPTSDHATNRAPPGGGPFGNAVIIGGAVVLAGFGATAMQYLSNFGIVGWAAIGIAIAVVGLALVATYIERRYRWARNRRTNPRYAQPHPGRTVLGGGVVFLVAAVAVLTRPSVWGWVTTPRPVPPGVAAPTPSPGPTTSPAPSEGPPTELQTLLEQLSKSERPTPPVLPRNNCYYEVTHPIDMETVQCTSAIATSINGHETLKRCYYWLGVSRPTYNGGPPILCKEITAMGRINRIR